MIKTLENINTISISYFHLSKFKDLDYEHNQRFSIEGFKPETKEIGLNNIIDEIMSKGYNIMLRVSKVDPTELSISIDKGNFKQR